MNDHLVQFHVPGVPRPKGSWRPVRNKKTGRTLFVADAKGGREWQAELSYRAIVAHPRKLYDGPVEVQVTFTLPRPRSVTQKRRPWPGVRPDLDKLARTVLDALEGTVLSNDSRVCRLLVEKKYDDDYRPGVSVSVAALTEVPTLMPELRAIAGP